MKKHTVTSPLILILLVILKTTVLRNIEFHGTKPDFVLIVMIIISNYFGTLKGELYGAAAGLVEDLLSVSPLGFNTFIRTFTGYLAGVTKGKIFLDPVITPVFLVAFFTIAKGTISFLLLLIFIPENARQVFNYAFLIKLVMNVLFTPFIFFLLKITKLIPEYEKFGI